MTTLTPEVLAEMERLFEAATPAVLCVDDHIVRPGDGYGMWHVFDAEEDDGPIASFNAEGDARAYVVLHHYAPALIAAAKAVEKLTTCYRCKAKHEGRSSACEACADHVCRDILAEVHKRREDELTALRQAVADLTESRDDWKARAVRAEAEAMTLRYIERSRVKVDQERAREESEE